MSVMATVKRETFFASRDRAFLIWMLVALSLSSISVWSGLTEIESQQATIKRVLIADEQDRLSELEKQSDWGGAAYYSFHFTYSEPSAFAFAALGQREVLPWKHRLRMLALEGQIYEHDSGNPELSLIGRFDYAFFAAFVLPLILIIMLHDLRASERTAGRYELLNATASSHRSLWFSRAALRATAIFLVSTIPLAIGGGVSGVGLSVLFSATVFLGLYIVFWTAVCLMFSNWQRSAPVILAALVGVWVLLGTVIPTASRMMIDQQAAIPSGADILMTQREAVNDAWDLPVSSTMTPFIERHPEWEGYVHSGEGFNWPWYYAFQQVGDQTAEQLSNAYQSGRLERDRLTRLAAILAPPVLLEHQLQSLASTDMRSAIRYENKVRAFHAELRRFFYPMLFGQKPFDAEKLRDLPEFNPS